MSARYAEHRAARVPRTFAGVEVLWSPTLAESGHGTWNGYSNYGCQCPPCRAAGVAYSAARASRPPRRRPPFLRHVCAAPRCRRKVPWTFGQDESAYRRVRYCCGEHREAARAARVAKARAAQEAARERACGCGCGRMFVPAGRRKLTATGSCQRRVASRAAAAAKAKAAPKREPSALATGVPGASRAGRRRPPKIVGARAPRIGGNAASDPPMQPRRSVFPDAAVTAPRRLGQVPVVERRVRTVPRPAFGLSRRAG